MENKIFIYNSLTRKKEEFIPLKPKKVKMYVCGPTVYDQPHIGHARSAYIFDVIRRYFKYQKYEVMFVRNVTDVDDKIIDKAQKEFPGEDLNTAVAKVSAKYLDFYHEDMKSLGIKEPDAEPKATGYVCTDKPLMQQFIQQLIDKGCAYVAEGDVYFDIKKAKSYGKLSNQDLEKMEAGARISLGEKKKDPLDFALWKAAKPGEPAWESPWGKGRPGWHIECSVMSSDILGDEFDIHGGGIDLIFPHHENEIAQSEGLGKKFARYWMHHGLLTINGQKMSKSLGNFITIKDVLEKYPTADVLKIFYLQEKYSSPVDFSWERLDETYKSIQRFDILFHNLGRNKKAGLSKSLKSIDFIEKNKDNFIKAMDDDFNTPKAMASLFSLVNDINKFMDENKDAPGYFEILNESERILMELGDILGLELRPVKGNINMSEKEIDSVIARRTKAKLDKDYLLADKIRKDLEGKGIILEDTKDGTIWRKKL